MEGAPAALILWAFIIGMYFLPSIIGRKKQNIASIFMLNCFLGWTFIGWVIAMVWAVKVEPGPSVFVYANGPSPSPIPKWQQDPNSVPKPAKWTGPGIDPRIED